MPSRIILTQPQLAELATRLARDTGSVAACPVGSSHLPHLRTYLVRSIEWIPRRVRASDDLLVVRAAPSADDITRVVDEEAKRFPSRGEGAVLAISFERGAISVGGKSLCEERVGQLDSIEIVGPGLPRIALSTDVSVTAAGRGLPGQDERWSRTIGALGETAWRRLTELNFAIIGCGRNGSLMATALARTGATSIALIDPDELEPHSLAEGDFAERSVALGKAEASRAFVMSLPHADTLRVSGLSESVFALPSLGAIKKSDVLICCVDNAAARYAAAFLAKLYLKPMLDIGTGILNGRDRPMGADIRLVLPDRCLLCYGGIAGLNSVQEAAGLDWRARRAGSLRSLNQIATGFGVRALEDFIGRRLRTSSWIQVDFSPTGAARLTHPDSEPSPACPLCIESGAGDGGLQSAGTKGDLPRP
jgi:hypothetical protein